MMSQFKYDESFRMVDCQINEFKYEMIAEYVAQKQKNGDTRNAQDIAVEYNDKVIC